MNIAPDKLQSTLGLKLPQVFTLLPCLASYPACFNEGRAATMVCIPPPKYGTIGDSMNLEVKTELEILEVMVQNSLKGEQNIFLVFVIPMGLVEKSKTNCIFHLVGLIVKF